MANEKPISKDYLLTQLKNYETEIINKKYIEKEDGKGLSSNDYTTEEKNKLAGLENYNDTALSQRVTDIENDYAKTTDIPTVPTKTSELTNDSGYLTEHQDISNLALKSEIPDVSSFITSDDLPTVPTKVSELTNDKNYISSIPSEYVTETELTAKKYLTSVPSTYALKTDIPTVPTKTSQLTNDSNFITSIPEEYVTETELNAKGYLTEHQDLSAYATKEEIPTVPSKVSELTNDSNYQTAEQVNSTVTTEIAKVVADAPEDFNTLKEMSDWIAGHEDDASAMNSAISDNKAAIASLQTDKADKSDIPTTLPADGGNADTVNNHTVKSDVPENAVFTDTVYDDTDIKAEIAKKADATSTPHIDETTKNWFIGDVDTGILAEGTNGTDGTTYTPSIGEVTTVDSTELASATVSVNTETNEAVFNFAIPKGEKGADGVQISDDETVENKTWSSQKTSSKIAEKIDKTSILTALDNYATDNQVYSAKALNTELDGVVKKTDIVDNLTSTDTDKPLSANQGKILNDTKLNKTDANKLNCVTIDNVSLKEYILTNFTEIGKTYYLIAKTTCTDLPKASNFYITVETPGLYTYKVTAKELNDSNGIYVCTYRSISSSWTEWEKVLITGDITTTISDSLVDKQDFRIFKSLEEFNEKKGTSFTVVSGVDNMKDIVNAMSNGEMLIITISYISASDVYFGLNASTGWTKMFTFIKANGLCDVECRTTTPSTFKRVLNADGVIGAWQELATTVAGVGVTTITPVNSNITGSIEYEVKNGICYVSMKDLMSTISSTNLLISNAMPKPSINYTASSVNAGGVIATIYIDKNTTNLRGNFYTKNAKSDCSFSYPVAES